MASDRTAGAANEASGLAAIFRRVCRVMDGSMVDTDERECAWWVEVSDG